VPLNDGVDGLDINEQAEEYPACTFCRHWIEGTRLCMAFKKMEIPDEIWHNNNPHTEPFPGDGGVVFELVTPPSLP
jgi:hypothetical protein